MSPYTDFSRRRYLSRRLLAHTFLFLSFALFIQPVHAVDWKNLWSSPEQRAKKKLDAQEYDALIEQAPDAQWRGVGEYKNADFAAAAKSFGEQRAKAQQAQRSDDAERAGFNQATSHVRMGEYQQAINLYDDILSTNPEHQNALHNRDIAQRLLEAQQQQEQNQSDSQNSDQQNESSENNEDGSESSGQNTDQPSQDGQQSDEQSSEESDDESDSTQSDTAQSDNNESTSDNADQGDAQQSEQQEADEAAQAAQAMQAERQRESAQPEQAQGSASDVADTRPLTEREQANEQWLRQIPDDPAGLLERKIQNRHLTDFPKVEHSDQPW